MRKILSFFSLLCCIVATSYTNDLTGKVLTQAKSTTDIVAGQWYTMTNNGYFLSDDDSGSLTTNTRAALNWASDVADMMVKFEKADDGYYIHTVNGKEGLVLTQDNDRMFCLEKNNSLFGQYWTMEKSGNGGRRQSRGGGGRCELHPQPCSRQGCHFPAPGKRFRTERNG